MRTTLVIPAYNEEEALSRTLDDYLDYVDEIVVVDDGSKDGTDRIARDYSRRNGKVKYFRHENNRGKPEALKTGVSNSSGDILVFTDADYTYPARYVPDLLSMIDKGSDLVLGSRIFSGANISRLNRAGNLIFSTLITFFCYSRIQDAQTGLRAMKREIFPELDVRAKNLEYETKMTMRAVKLGYNVAEIPIQYRKRIGRSKLNPFKDGFNMMRSILAIVWRESTPLMRGIMAANAFTFLAGLAFGLYSVYEKLAHGLLAHEFYPLISVVFILASIQLMSFSLIMEFIVNKLGKIESAIQALKR